MEETKMLQAIRGIFREETASLREEMTGLHKETASLREEMTGLHKETASLREEMTGLHKETASLREEMTGLHKETASLRVEFQQNLEKTEKNILEVLRKEIRASENSTLEEVDRLQEIMERRIGEVNEKIENVERYYRISRLENDNTTLVLQIVEDYGRRLEKLERVIA